MFNIIVRASLNNRLFVLIGALALAFYGAFAASRLSVDVTIPMWMPAPMISE